MDGGLAVRQMFGLRTPEGQYELMLPVYGRDIQAGPTITAATQGTDIKIGRLRSAGVFNILAKANGSFFNGPTRSTSKNCSEAFLDTLPVAERAKFKDRLDAPEFTQFKNGSFVLQVASPGWGCGKKAAEEVLRPMSSQHDAWVAMNQPGPPLVDMTGGRFD
jgi:hypothetical protein